MIAKRLGTVLRPALALVTISCTAIATCAQAATPAAARTGAPRVVDSSRILTQEDVDLLLREVRASIQQGQLDKADTLLKRAESANFRYSRFHMGATPDSVRRELARAQQAARTSANQQAGAPAQGASRFLPFARKEIAPVKQAQDPFLADNRARQAAPNQAQPNAQQRAPQSARTNPAQRLNQQPGSDSQLSTLPSLGKAMDNPFVQGDRMAPSRQNVVDAQQGKLNQPNAFDGQAPSQAYAQLRAGRSNALPDAPMPAVPRAQQAQAKNTSPYPTTSVGLMPPQSASRQLATGNVAAAAPTKQKAKEQMAAARQALGSGDLDLAEKLSRAATSMGVPESEFLPDEDRPSLVAWDVVQARHEQPAPQNLTRELPPVAAASPAPVSQLPSAYLDNAPSRAQLAAPATSAAAPRAPIQAPLAPSTALTEPDQEVQIATDEDSHAPIALTAGELPPQEPLGHQDLDAAMPADVALPADNESTAHVEAAAEAPAAKIAAQEAPPAEDLPMPVATPPVSATKADANKTSETNAAENTAAAKSTPPKSLLESAEDAEIALAKQLSAEVGKRQSEAMRLQTEDPERAVATLREAQQLVNDSKLPESARRELLSRIDITLAKTEKYVKDHKTEIELDKHNEEVMNDVHRERETKLKVQQKMADLIEDFNKLRDEQRYAEMEIVARRLIELAPDDPVAQQTWLTAKFIRREMLNRQVALDKEISVWESDHAVESAMLNPVAKDGQEMVFAKDWGDLVGKRKGSREQVQRRTERELEIERRLKTPVLLKYTDTPLREVVDSLSQLTGVNIHLDPRGLSQEGLNTDTPVTINLSKEVQLKSALNLILEPLHLSYVINDEVLKITSEQLRDGEIYPITYNVADLVTPIPNFVPSNNIGLQGLINEATASAGHGQLGLGSNPAAIVNNRGQQPAGAGANDQVLAQQFNAAPAAGGGMSQSTVPIGAGPGGMGGGANADFDSLIDLIVSTVQTETWAENGGGEAEIRPFPTNLSLVISQTQAVHEEIADLLEQLRRLQDLQVTIEVRFIRLNDRFFERIGIDFDMNIDDEGVTAGNATEFQPVNAFGHTNTVGVTKAATGDLPAFTSDLDIPFRQGSFQAALPPVFSGFDPNSAATFGFAILSDIEAFFVIEAAQGDARTNVLNAPKVTLFNGQQAFVADATQRPFVVGVIPVVGEFAAAQQPVIVVLNEGTMMTIQAVVSDDRRYVRMTIVPFFTQIGDVDTFTFEGTSSTTSSSSATDSDEDGKNEKDDQDDQEVRSGVTVQLPSFSFVSVVTTVSVPDGGTVLLGGIKRLNEGRNEFGVPLLSKVPYVNRLFRNIGIGRSTDSLMMMVTPRIIIQEEEEERLGIAIPGS